MKELNVLSITVFSFLVKMTTVNITFIRKDVLLA